MIDKKELVALIKKLIAIKSPYFMEKEAVSYCYDWLTKQGFSPILHTYCEEKITKYAGENVVCKIGSGSGTIIHLNGHLDTVQECRGWSKDPYDGEITGNRLYGLGAMDMKAGCAALMLAVKAFKERYAEFDGQIILSLVSDEEGPYGLGTNALIEDGILDNLDCHVVTEPTAGFSSDHAFPLLCIGARGCLIYAVEFYGQSSHASQPEKGVNAAIEAAKFAAACENISLDSAPPLGKGSLCVLKIEGDGGACSVPDFARVMIHRHVTMGETEAAILKEAESLVEKAGVKCSYKIKLKDYPTEGSKSYLPYYVDRNNEYVRKMEATITEVCGKPPVVDYFASIGDFNYLGTRLGNVPTLIFGPDGGNVHGADEYVDIDSAYDTAVTIYKFLENILK